MRGGEGGRGEGRQGEKDSVEQARKDVKWRGKAEYRDQETGQMRRAALRASCAMRIRVIAQAEGSSCPGSLPHQGTRPAGANVHPAPGQSCLGHSRAAHFRQDIMRFK